MSRSAPSSLDAVRHPRRTALVAAALLLLVAAAVLVTRGDRGIPGDVPAVPTPPDVRDRREASPLPDPFAYDPARESDFERRAAAGTAHVLYARSPAGAVATAGRVARWRPRVEAAAKAAGVPADQLEALVFLESAGREDAVASDTEGAVGLTQILAQTGQSLLGMHVDVPRSRRLTRRIGRAAEHGRNARAAALVRERRAADERYDPVKALAGTARYLTIAQEELGRDDLAFVSYHMGIGNLQSVLALYGDEQASYARVYFDSTPDHHADVQRKLASFGDDSSTYLWRLGAARAIMRLFRTDRPALERQQELQTAKNSAEEVLHPLDETERFADPAALRKAYEDGGIRGFPNDPAVTALVRDARMGELAERAGAEPGLYRGLRPEALAMAMYIGAQVRHYSGRQAPLAVTSTVRDEAYQAALVRRNREATRNYSLHTTGWAFDVARTYATQRQALAFQFVLDRLQILDEIAWVREPGAIHVTAAGGNATLLPLLERLG